MGVASERCIVFQFREGRWFQPIPDGSGDEPIQRFIKANRDAFELWCPDEPLTHEVRYVDKEQDFVPGQDRWLGKVNLATDFKDREETK